MSIPAALAPRKIDGRLLVDDVCVWKKQPDGTW